MADKKLQKPALQSSPDDLPVEVLDPHNSAQYYSLRMPRPIGELARYVDHYWIMRWDVPEVTSFMAEIIPSPYVNLTFMKEGARVTGVTTGKYSYEVEGAGVIVGTKFLPGGYFGLTQRDASQVTDQAVPADKIFTEITQVTNSNIMSAEPDDVAVQLMESILLPRLPEPDGNIELVQSIVDSIKNGEILRVSSLVNMYDIDERRLQELFKKYVGVSPKWVILRYRLIRAVGAATIPTSQNWTELAMELGYSDQSHFINDFKRIIGITPREYADRKHRM